MGNEYANLACLEARCFLPLPQRIINSDFQQRTSGTPSLYRHFPSPRQGANSFAPKSGGESNVTLAHRVTLFAVSPQSATDLRFQKFYDRFGLIKFFNSQSKNLHPWQVSLNGFRFTWLKLWRVLAWLLEVMKRKRTGTA